MFNVKIEDPIPDKDEDDLITSWNVNIHVEHDNGITQFVPVTVYRYQVPDMTIGSIVEVAVREALPGQIAMAYGKYKINDPTQIEAKKDG